MKRFHGHKLILVWIIPLILNSCAYKILFWDRNIWQDFYGLFTLIEPADMDLYRKLLPEQFEIPEEPMVGIFLVNYVDTEPWMITFTEFLLPYFESSIFLRCRYEGQIGWYSLTMPVTTEAANIGGRRLGFPKYVADEIKLNQSENMWHGTVVHKGETVIDLKFTPGEIDKNLALSPTQHLFLKGKGDAQLKGPVILLKPPLKGPEVNVLPCTPPPRVQLETGMIQIHLEPPFDGLIEKNKAVPGLFQRFKLDE